MARLMVSIQGAEFAFDLRGDGVKVGAAATNGLVLKDSTVSKEHLELRRMGPTWRLVDLESAAGTRVNGLFVNKQDLKDGDVIAVGSARLTFKADEGPAPMPAPAMAPIPGVSQAPIMTSPVPTPVPVSPVYAAPVAYAPPPPVHRPPPPPARETARERDRDRGRDREDDRDRRRGRSRGGGGGKAGGAMGAMFLVAIAVGFVALLIVLNKQQTKQDVNVAILKQISEARAQGRLDVIAGFEGQGDQSFSYTYREIQVAIADAKKVLGERNVLASAEESESYYRDQIKAPRANRSLDGPSLTLRCDEFLRRWPNHEKANDVLFIRLCLNAEPPSFWAQVRGGDKPGQPGYISPGTLLGASETEAERWLNDGNYAACFRIYQMFIDKSKTTVAADQREKFRADMAPKLEFIARKAKDAFEKVEEKAMVLEDRKEYERAQTLYKEARELYGVPEILIRCDAELERLKEKLR
jgi:hypothetical protein